MCWARRVRAALPLAPARYARKQKPHKTVRQNPTNLLSQQCTPVFLYIDGVI